MSTWRYAKECTDCRRPASWPTNSSRNDWHVMATLSNCTHWDYGNMSLTRCGSTFVWTILALSILEENIFNIYMMHYKRKHMKLWKIGPATYIAGLCWNGTTRNTIWILLCQYMSWNNSQNTVTLLPWNHSIARIHTLPANMAKTTNSPLPLTKVFA